MSSLQPPDPTPPPALRGAPSDPKQRLLDAAERLFAERGFEGVSMRVLTRAAGLSVSAVNYHFGSKEELLRATLQRRVDPVNRRRLRELDQLEAAAQTPGVEALVECFLSAAVDQFEALRERGEPSLARHVLARLYTDPPDLVEILKTELFGEVNERFAEALGRALPGISPERVALLLQLGVGTMVHVIGGQVDERLLEALTTGDRPGPTTRARSGPGDSRAAPLLALLVAYVSAGLRAGAATGSAPRVAPSRRPR